MTASIENVPENETAIVSRLIASFIGRQAGGR
jgi:hypothetical protein